MTYLLVFLGLFFLELIYFKIANHYNIIDKPNERSSHTTVTLRGGGIVFYLGVMVYFFLSGFQSPWFFLGLTMMTMVSFADDVMTLPNNVRLIIHFISVMLMAYQLQIFNLSWYYLLLAFVGIVGVVNAYNFMDGINGITAAYSLSVSGLLLIVNYNFDFISPDFLYFTMLSILVFAYFNFRNTAMCFAGDVGSVAIAYILLFALGSLVMNRGNMIYVLFLSVYGVDVVWTVVRRIYMRENIFEAHRTHLYQFLVNEAGFHKLIVTMVYGLIQFLIGLLVIVMANQSDGIQWIFSIVLLLGLSVFYLSIKTLIIKKYVGVSKTDKLLNRRVKLKN